MADQKVREMEPVETQIVEIMPPAFMISSNVPTEKSGVPMKITLIVYSSGSS